MKKRHTRLLREDARNDKQALTELYWDQTYILGNSGAKHISLQSEIDNLKVN